MFRLHVTRLAEVVSSSERSRQEIDSSYDYGKVDRQGSGKTAAYSSCTGVLLATARRIQVTGTSAAFFR